MKSELPTVPTNVCHPPKDPKRNAFYPTENAGKCGVEKGERERTGKKEGEGGPRQNRNGRRGKKREREAIGLEGEREKEEEE